MQLMCGVVGSDHFYEEISMFGVRGSRFIAAPASLATVLAVLVMASDHAAAQRPDSLKAPRVQRQVGQTEVEARLAILTRPEVAEQLATFTRNYFEALLRKGFTREEASRIVAGTALEEALGSH
jgi:hypothetical protein